MRTLASLALERRHCGTDEAIRIIVGICDALNREHATQPITPASVLVANDGSIHLTETDEYLFGYLAPELLIHAPNRMVVEWSAMDGERVRSERTVIPAHQRTSADSMRATVFSLGCILWELLSGGPLFSKSSDLDTITAILSHRVPPALSVPMSLNQILARALAFDPNQRFRTAAELALALRTLTDEGPDRGCAWSRP
jgi:eukaryotic-like serine/threonine-protein kinase